MVIILPGGQKVPRPLDNRLRSFHPSEFFRAPPSVGILELGVGRLDAERVGRFGSPKNGRKTCPKILILAPSTWIPVSLNTET